MIFPPADTEPTMTRYQPLADCGKAFLTLPNLGTAIVDLFAMLSCPELGLLEEKTGSNLRAASTTFYYENILKYF